MSIRTHKLATALLSLPRSVSAAGAVALIVGGQAVSFGAEAASGPAQSSDWIHQGDAPRPQ